MDPSHITDGVKSATTVRQTTTIETKVRGSNMNGSKTVVHLGIDLGKNSFPLWGVNEQGERVLKKKVRRSGLLREVANIPPCRIGRQKRVAVRIIGRARLPTSDMRCSSWRRNSSRATRTTGTMPRASANGMIRTFVPS